MRLRLQRRWAAAAAAAVLLSLTFAATAGAQYYIYWWQQNMPVSRYGVDPFAHNHTYNELYFGPNAGRLAQTRATYDPDGFFTQPQDY